MGSSGIGENRNDEVEQVKRELLFPVFVLNTLISFTSHLVSI